MAIATANGRDLFYERTGTGPTHSGEPLLLIMGMSGTHRTWGTAFPALLAEAFDVVVYDHRGIGTSAPLADQPFTLRDLADDAAGLLDALGWESAHLCGISMGGMVAQELVLADPARVRTLTLGCTMAGGPTATAISQADLQLLSEGMLSGDYERALRTAWEVNVSASFAAEDGSFTAFRAQASEVRAPLPTILAQMQAIAAFDVAGRLHEITVPTQVLHGTEDRMVPFANAQILADGIQGARLHTFDGVGHLFFVEEPARSAAYVRELASVPAAR